ncbi:amino acid adenylation domain protein [Rippkaea orientalis PCC 8801]|uniref:Amino acid adenylation domain protein n=1 Tax=Rippkaea orientalis (strain PCC 8801 / RF-1) TaxID=41431 RepID=B7K2U2_RIPO1|nr:non-ribosomal peptide synthetase [Rippkaea orientalis]ACK67643.1 amino acid adenylation domain protein [Rippkaea orientalis PCC 8801]
MKPIEEFLNELANLEVKLWLEEGRVRCRATKGKLTPELHHQLSARKQEILKFLQSNQLNTSPIISQIKSVSRSEPLPLSFAQQRLWFLDQLEGQKAAYNEVGVIRLEGTLNASLLSQSFEEIIRRHEILRTNLQTKGEEVFQVISESKTLEIKTIDIASVPTIQQPEALKQIASREIEIPFNLEQDLLLRVALIRLTEKSHILLVVMHHIVCDGWSFGILIEELSTLYKAYQEGKSSPLPELTIQYADFAVWQREWLTGETLEKKLDYWTEKLSGLPPLLELPTDYRRPPVQSFKGSHISFNLNSEISEKLKQLSQQTGVTLFMTLLTAFSILLSRYSRQKDIAIGSPIANRNRGEIESLIGFFVNTLVMRVNLQDNPTVEELLTQVKKSCLEAYSHQDVPFEKLVEELKPERNMSYSPMFQVMFVLQNTPSQELSLPGLTLSSVEIEYNIAKFDLTLSMSETDNGLAGDWEYNTDLFERETIERMIGNFQVLLEEIVSNPQEKIGKLTLLTEVEKDKILVEWNDTKRDYPKDKCIHQLFDEQVEKTPDAIALVYEEEQLTYRELNQKSNQLAHYLQKLGVKPDTLVGICVDRSLEMIIGLLGILKAGGAYVPIDPNYPAQRIEYMLSDARVNLLLTQERFKSLFLKFSEQILFWEHDQTNWLEEIQTNPINQTELNHLAYINYTSGSTGQPKGVMIPHKGVVRLLINPNYVDLDSQTNLLHLSPIAFDASTFEIWGALLHGGKCVLFSEKIPTALALKQTIEKHKINTLWLTSALFNSVVDELPDTLGEIKQLLTGGEALSVNHINQALKVLPSTQLIDGYGPTESTTFTCCYLIPPSLASDILAIPIGKPISNTQVYILDTNLQPVPIGVAGELHIGGDGLARGYLNRPELTAEKFIVNPFDPTGESRLYKTGDLCRYLRDGNLEYIGRIDHQVKIRGFRIELGEIESILSIHPDIRESVVIAREDQPGNKRLVAYLVSKLIPERLHYVKACQLEIKGKTYPVESEDFSVGGMGLGKIPVELGINDPVKVQIQLPGQESPSWLSGKVIWYRDNHGGIEWTLTSQESERVKQSYQLIKEELGVIASLQRSLSQGLREYLKEKLPDYMVPSAFVLLEKLPLTPNGKIDRKALPAPDWSNRGQEDYIAPQTPNQEILASIWQNVLPKEKIGVKDNFFELGGHSLLATQVISRIRETFSLDLPIRSVFENPTLEELAQEIENSQKVEINPIIPINRAENLTLSFAQQRLWFLDQLEGENATYNIPGALKLEGSLKIEALEKSLNQIIKRHESLRTRFKTVNGEAVQIIDPEGQINLKMITLESLDESEKKSQTQSLIKQEAEKPFNLSQDRLIRASLIKLGSESHILLITMHHIISDGWSMGVFVQELTSCYSGYGQGKETQLKPLSIQYADFAVWQREWLCGENLQKQLNYWKKKLTGLPPLIELPTDHPRPPIQSFQGSHISFNLTSEMSEKLKQMSQQTGVTLFMTLLTAFSILLSRYSRQEDIAIGSPIANRNRAEIEPLIGFFVNTLVMRVSLEDNPTVEELLKQVRKTCLEAYSHQDVPFEKLVEEVKPERNMSHSPLFQVMFVLQNAPDEELSLPGLTVSPVEIEYNIAKFDLTLSMAETEKGLAGDWEYNTDLFERKTIERMIGHFQVLLEGIVNHPQEKIGQLPLLTEAEKQQILGEWNDTKADYPKEKCIHQLFEEQVERTPDAVAVVYEDQQLTYLQLNQKANQLAHYLIKFGVKPDTLVGICVERSLEMVMGLLGILKAGGAYVPIDPNYPAERIEYMLKDSAVSILLTQERLVKELPETQAQMICLDKDWLTISQENPNNCLSQVNAKNLAYIIYTSGSTGNPKGVMIEHNSLVNFRTTAIEKYQFTVEDRILQFSSISFDAASEEIYPCLTIGATLVLRTQEILTGGIGLLEQCRKCQLTILDLPTAFWYQIVSELSMTKNRFPETLRLIIVGGEAVTTEHIQTWIAWTENTPQLVNSYGPTEATVVSTIWLLESSEVGLSVPIGRPLANIQTYILDPNLKPVPIGVAGELHIGGDGLARGYLNRPELTAEKFIPNPFDPTRQSKLYKSGDLCRYSPDGNIEYIGRIDHQVKIRGFRIELGEIESLLSTHPEIRESVVILREHEPGNKRLVAYLVSNLIPERLHYAKPCQLEINSRSYSVQSEDFSVGGMGLAKIPVELGINDPVKVQIQLPGQETPRWLSGKVIWYRDRHTGIEWILTPAEKKIVEQSYQLLKEELGIMATLQRSLSQGLRRYLKEKLPDYMIPSAFVLLEKLPLTPNGKIDRKALPAPDWSDRGQEDYIAPRDAIEIKLAQIWSNVLNVSPISIKDNFFELGGHSLLAVRLIAEVKQEFNQHLPLVTLFNSPTIEQLASLLRTETPSVSWSSLVPIQTQGDQPPFFCVPGVGGNVIYLYDLARYLGKDHPFYGLQSVGLDGESAPYTTIKAMAEHYIKLIQSVQPKGPYYLGGHSFGGWVAFEMAQQLQQQGQEVKCLALLDTPPFQQDKDKDIPDNEDDTRWMISLIKMIEYSYQTSFQISEEQLRRLTAEEQLHLLHEILQNLNLVPSGNDIRQVQGVVQVFKASSQITYHPQTILPLPLTLFCAKEESLIERQSWVTDWQKSTTLPIQVEWVAGKHQTMMESPHVQKLAQCLQQYWE